MPLLRRKPKPPKPPVAVALWTTAPKLRPLKQGESLPVGSVVYVDGMQGTYAIRDWQWMGPTGYPVLDPCEGQRHDGWPQVQAAMLRIVDDGQPSRKGGKR